MKHIIEVVPISCGELECVSIACRKRNMTYARPLGCGQYGGTRWELSDEPHPDAIPVEDLPQPVIGDMTISKE